MKIGRSIAPTKGAAMVEYGFIVSIVVTLSIGTISTLGGSIADVFVDSSVALQSSGTGPPEPSGPADPCEALSIGDTCAEDGTTYIGTSASGRVYTDFTPHSWGQYKSSYASGPGDLSTTNGYQNTQTLIAHETSSGVYYDHVNVCLGLGTGWYLPAIGELQMLSQYLTDNAIDYDPIYHSWVYSTSTLINSGSEFVMMGFGNPSAPMSEAIGATRDVTCLRTFVG